MDVAILAGGNNRRFHGVNKALLKLGDKTLIEIIINKCEKIFDKIFVIVKTEQQVEQLNKFLTGQTIIVKDLLPQQSALAGIYSAIMYSITYYTFVLATDMPFVNTQLLEYMVNCSKNNDADVIIPKLKNNFLPNNGYETLHAIYSKNCAKYIKEQIKNGNAKIISFFKYVKLKEINENIIKQFDPDLLSFFNINKIDDYKKSIKIYTEKGGKI